MRFHGEQTDRVSGTVRIEAFSDGVLAILVTLLILDVHVPHLADDSLAAFRAGLLDVFPNLLSFGFSFIAICIFWVNHHHFYRQLTHADWPLLWHNCHLLFWLTLLPFTTAFLGAYPASPFVASLYAFVMCMAALAFNLMVRHALFHGALAHPSITAEARKRSVSRGVVGIVCYALGSALAFVSVWLAWIMLIVMPLYYFVPRLMGDGEALEEA